MSARCWDRNILVQYNYSILELRVGLMNNSDRTVVVPPLHPESFSVKNILTAVENFEHPLS